MDHQIAWRVELVLKPGQRESLLALAGAMLGSVRTEPGVLRYQRFASDDGGLLRPQRLYGQSSREEQHWAA